MISFRYPGVLAPIAAEFTLSRGVTPSVCTLKMLPQDGTNFGPGTLRINYDGGFIDFPGCNTGPAFLRKHTDNGRQRWSLQIFDRRWRWCFGAISGEYNKRLPNGLVDPDFAQTPSQLATFCLNALGETNFDVSLMPGGVWPYVNWQATNPGLALAALCDYVGCDICLGPEGVAIWPVGTGSNLPLDDTQRHRVFPLGINRPSRVIVVGGPTRWETKLALEAIANEQTGQQKRLADATYKPAAGWAGELPYVLPGVTATEDRAAALDTVLRHYRIKGQAQGGLAVPSCLTPIASIDQYLPLGETLLQSAADLDGFSRQLPAFVRGDFWPYSDEPTNVSDKRYTGPLKLHGERGTVEFPQPIYSFTSTASVQEPTLYLTTSYGVKSVAGEAVRLYRERWLAGNGGALILRRPEIFATYRFAYAGNQIGAETSTEANAQAEADVYLDIFAARYADTLLAGEMEYAGIKPLIPDGKIAQVKFSAGVDRLPLTHASLMGEFEVLTTGAAERRRREIVRHFAEALG